jgi:anti-sigma factor RsiW
MILSRDELEQRLMPYVDGELRADEAAAVERALAEHPDLAREAAALRDLSLLTRAAFAPAEAHVASVDFSALHATILARLEPAATPARAIESPPTLGARIGAWWRDFFAFERPLALAGFAAVTVAVLGTLALRSDEPALVAPSSVAISTPAADAKTARVRRGPEEEVAIGDRGAVRVESVEVTDGRVFVEGGSDETDKPLVLWHVVEGEGAVNAPAGGGL